ncbi:MAG: hypothetical protein K2X93_19565 [Candidatus Obscuribacterales bacterium]|nr:hypothetical protein [Candidatus Obscuribacterales bacterium]
MSDRLRSGARAAVDGGMDDGISNFILFDSKCGEASISKLSIPEAPEPENSDVADLPGGLWVEQFASYLDGKPFLNHKIPDDPRPLKVRAMSVGLEEYDKIAPNGMRKSDLETSLKDDPFGSFDPLGLQVLLGNFELVDGLEKKDGMITRSELARLSVSCTNLRTFPNGSSAKPMTDYESKLLEGQRVRTEAVINSRVDKYPTHSHGNFFDTAVKGMAKAVLNGDVDTFNKMVEEFSNHKPLLERAAKQLDYLLYPAGVRVRFAENRSGPQMVLTAKDGSMICFSPTDRPMTDDLGLSASEIMNKIGRETAGSADKMAEYFADEDREILDKHADKKLISGLSARLDAGDSKVMAELLATARKGNVPAFNEVVSTALRLDSNAMHNVANALNEIVGARDIRFSVTNEQGTDARMQIRNRTGDKSLTMTSRNVPIVGATGIAPSRDADSIGELIKWVFSSLNRARM